MVKIIIALSVFAVLLAIATFFAIRRQVKHYCEWNELDFKRYWHDFLRGKVNPDDAHNEYFMLQYKKKKETIKTKLI